MGTWEKMPYSEELGKREAAAFVGRETELHLLESALRKVGRDSGNSFIIGGESGVGKSRLVAAASKEAQVMRHPLRRDPPPGRMGRHRES